MSVVNDEPEKGKHPPKVDLNFASCWPWKKCAEHLYSQTDCKECL